MKFPSLHNNNKPSPVFIKGIRIRKMSHPPTKSLIKCHLRSLQELGTKDFQKETKIGVKSKMKRSKSEGEELLSLLEELENLENEAVSPSTRSHRVTRGNRRMIFPKDVIKSKVSRQTVTSL